MEWQKGEFSLTNDREALDLSLIHGFLQTSYWAKGIPRETVARAIANSLPFGLFHNGRQVGFCRVISDHATFAYLADVFVVEGYRGQGLAKWLVSCVLAHPELQGLRRWMLATLDAHGLYRQFGFTAPARPERLMEITDPEIYIRKNLESGEPN